ncbi:hypothetical protein [Sediminibacterium sp.]|uniref:hypothetical protein n=1 Tax=Sediminibacterium sp. TaxID=1917865 RepID=UPI003F6EABED
MPKRTFHSGAIINGKPIEVECIPIINKNKCVILCKSYGITIFDMQDHRIIFSKQILDEGYRKFIQIAVRMWLKNPNFLKGNNN